MSVSQDKISRTIYVHDIDNPPATGQSMNVHLNVINSKHFLISNWDANTQPPSFTLKVIDPISIGLPDLQDYNVEKFVDKVLLACNLVLKSAVFTRHGADPSRTAIERKLPEAKATHVKEETTQGVHRVEITEVLQITDEVHIHFEFKDDLDEKLVLQILDKINTLEGLSVSNSLNVLDLKKSLMAYASAMSSTDRLGIFKHHYSSIELATNCDGVDRVGRASDSEVNRITGTSTLSIQDWREFNDRLKHINRTPQEEAAYQEGLSKIGEKINPLRGTCQKIILQRLQNI